VQDAGTKAPLISVIVPAYRAAEWIGAALASVLAQTLQDFEIIVVNDGSPDTAELERVLEPYRARIIYLCQENRGLAGARNTGVRAARGKYIAPLDADDIWDPEFLAAQAAILEADPSFDLVYADARIFGDGPDCGKTVMELSPSEGEVTFERLVRRQCSVHVCVTLVRRNALIHAGLFDESFRMTEDIDMWLRILLSGGRITYQRRVLGKYRRRVGSLSSNPLPMIESYLRVLAKMAGDPRTTTSQQAAIAAECVEQRALLALHQGKREFVAGEMGAAISHLAEANRHFRSARLAAIVTLLRVAPHFLRSLYVWRDRHVYRPKTQP